MRALLRRFCVPILLVWLALAGLYLAQHDSMTSDEGVHVASGYLALTRHDFRFDPEHPFLFKVSSALPFLFVRTNLPVDDQALWQAAAPSFYDSWQQSRQWGDEWFFQSGNNTNQMLLLSRLASVLSMVLLGWLLYRVGREAFSERVGRYTLFFYAFNPTLLAHGHLANDDLAVALAMTWCLWRLWLYQKERKLPNLLWLSLALALALLTKFSAIILVVFVPLYSLWRFHKEAIRPSLLLLLLSWLGIWVAYLFHSPVVLATSDPNLVEITSMSWLSTHHVSLELIRHLIPLDYLKGLILVNWGTVHGRGAYLLGQHFGNSIWYYFPVLFFLKTQVIALLALLAASLLGWRRFAQVWRNPAYQIFGGFTLLFVVVAMVNKLDLGIRHISPVLTLASLFMALAWVQLNWSSWLLTLYVLPVLFQMNQLLGFANILVQPNRQTWRFYNDSNLDWGASNKALAQVAKERFPGQILFANTSLDSYGVTSYSFDPKQPPLHSLILLMGTQLSDDSYVLFRTLTPVAEMGNQGFFYILQDSGTIGTAFGK